MKSTEIRKAFTVFFKKHDHIVLPSYSLVPRDDPTLLLINAGMAPFKAYFEGSKAPPGPRVCTIQKCFRALDIDEVGKTPRHNTFFEMLGNFSFGDYFKEEVIPWAWEFLTKDLEISPEKLSVSVFEEDDEAYDIWHKKVGLDESRIFRLGKEHNFWEMGETGPCGPDSEIFFDLGEEFGCDSPSCAPGCDCERWPEIWNLVFTQFLRKPDRSLEQLPTKNVDTGMGMERLCMIMQGVTSVFEIDQFRAIYDYGKSISSSEIIESKRHISGGVNSLYLFCDHIRAVCFLLADGVYPANEGRGYVLRRVIRRCLIHLGKLDAATGTFVGGIEPVIDTYGSLYPNLVEKRDFITELLTVEEEGFNKVIERNYEELKEKIGSSDDTFSGEDAFFYYDTRGVPIDLIRDMLHSAGKELDEEVFTTLLIEQKEKGRKATAIRKQGDKNLTTDLNLPGDLPRTEVLFHEFDNSPAKVLHADDLNEIVILDKSPFYPEAGGQSGDVGEITDGNIKIRVTDTKATDGGIILHFVGAESKPFLVGLAGKDVEVRVDDRTRRGIRRAHTGTHLLHAAFRKVIGEHVTQSGSSVNPDEFRFDFTHMKPVTKDEIRRIEEIVNGWILASLPVKLVNTTLQGAKDLNAMALFEGKYDEEVRMIEIGDDEIISRELCGGLHLGNTSEAGFLAIISESGIAAGVRRITAVTGEKALAEFHSLQNRIDEAALLIDTDSRNIVDSVAKLLASSEVSAKEIKKLKKELSSGTAEELLNTATVVNDIRVIATVVADSSPNDLSDLSERIKKKAGAKAGILLASCEKTRITLTLILTSDLVSDGYHAGNIMKSVVNIVGGKGGGKPTFAQGGGTQPEKLDEAFDAFRDAFRKDPE